MYDERHIGFEIRTLSNLIKRKVDNFVSRKYIDNITGIHSWVIGYIYKNSDKDIFQRDIEEEFSIRRSTATTILQLMEKNNLIVRKSVDYDARLKKIELTDKAIKVHEMVREDILKLEAQLVQGLTKEEISSFFNIIDKIKGNL